jgi:hypothetical protein
VLARSRKHRRGALAECDRERASVGVTAMPRLQQRRRAIPPPGCGSGPFSPLLTAEGVAGAHDWCRGKGIASPDQPREPKQSWRPPGPTGPDVRDHDRAPSLRNPDSEQAGSRSCVGRHRTDGRRDLDYVATARLGRSGHLIAAALSAAPFRPLRKPGLARVAVPAFWAEQ